MRSLVENDFVVKREIYACCGSGADHQLQTILNPQDRTYRKQNHPDDRSVEGRSFREKAPPRQPLRILPSPSILESNMIEDAELHRDEESAKHLRPEGHPRYPKQFEKPLIHQESRASHDEERDDSMTVVVDIRNCLLCNGGNSGFRIFGGL